jgi:hypothetical protein
MYVLFRNCAITIAANCILLTSLGGQQTTSPADQSFKTEGHKSQKQHKKKATKELSNDQRDWLNNDVPYIIIPRCS